MRYLAQMVQRARACAKPELVAEPSERASERAARALSVSPVSATAATSNAT